MPAHHPHLHQLKCAHMHAKDSRTTSYLTEQCHAPTEHAYSRPDANNRPDVARRSQLLVNNPACIPCWHAHGAPALTPSHLMQLRHRLASQGCYITSGHDGVVQAARAREALGGHGLACPRGTCRRAHTGHGKACTGQSVRSGQVQRALRGLHHATVGRQI